ncbi:cell division protein FtsA [Virgibacillus flavescens]|uniref:cell division protein FtsA n=1 Tax=Virgibacillus flavescens TaxID=1611422 RepID=UPI003D32B831
MNENLFALDIGTRSVTGIILEKNNSAFSIIDYYTIEHTERSMHDGQIHNVPAVSKVITKVKDHLEEKHGTLASVSVAAAGRSLKTIQTDAKLHINQQPILDNETIKHLELSAVHAAQQELATVHENGINPTYFCVGYSVLHYKLDGELMGSLIDQTGEEASVEIIATFLPKVVVESLIAALSRSDLEMNALTLEPIAAIHVLIPESMRKLNIALVDIGAGTSDIAITDQGTVAAYGMVPIAGDEITEAVSENYLLDFPVAEQTKRDIVTNGEAVVTDILGFKSTITYDTLVHDIRNTIDNLAQSIANEIIQLNSKPTKAVMLIGGGSLTPEIITTLAGKLQLPENRVAVRGIDAIQNLTNASILPPGPDYITPIGIAIAAKENPVHYISVTVNNNLIRMFEMKQLTIGDCLVQAGIEIKKYYGKPGIASLITVNGKCITLPGGYGQPPKIYLNDKEASVETPISNDNQIRIEKGENGVAPDASIENVIGDMPSKFIKFNGQAITINPIFHVNNKIVTKNYVLKDRDELRITQVRTIRDFLSSNSTEKLNTLQPFTIYVNQKECTINAGKSNIYLNDKVADANENLKDGDSLTLQYAIIPTVADLLKERNEQYNEKIHVSFNSKPITMCQQRLLILRNSDQELFEDSLLKNGDHITIKSKAIQPFIFQDIFRYIDIDLSKVNSNFQLYKNDTITSFDAIVEDKDRLQIDY